MCCPYVCHTCVLCLSLCIHKHRHNEWCSLSMLALGEGDDWKRTARLCLRTVPGKVSHGDQECYPADPRGSPACHPWWVASPNHMVTLWCFPAFCSFWYLRHMTMTVIGGFFSPSWHIGPICQCVWFYSNVLQDHDFWGTKHTDRSSRHANCWADLPRQRQICLLGTRGGSTWRWPHGYRDSQLHHQGIRKRTSSSCYSDSIFQIFVCLLFNFIRLTA